MKRRDNVGLAFFFIVIAFVLTMSILSSVFLGVDNYIQKKRSGIPVYIFCKKDVSGDGVRELVSWLKRKKGVVRVKLIDRQKAFMEIMKRFGIDRSLFDKNPFPYSIEVFFEPSYTDLSHFEAFKKLVEKNPAVDDVRYPRGILLNMQTIQKRVSFLMRSVLAMLYAVEFVVFVSVISVLYSHRRFDFDTLKFFGIKRTSILFMFLRQTLTPALSGVVVSALLAVIVYYLYDKYADVYYISSQLFKSSFVTMFVVNVVVGILFSAIASLFVFAVNDEKV